MTNFFRTLSFNLEVLFKYPAAVIEASSKYNAYITAVDEEIEAEEYAEIGNAPWTEYIEYYGLNEIWWANDPYYVPGANYSKGWM